MELVLLAWERNLVNFRIINNLAIYFYNYHKVTQSSTNLQHPASHVQSICICTKALDGNNSLSHGTLWSRTLVSPLQWMSWNPFYGAMIMLVKLFLTRRTYLRVSYCLFVMDSCNSREFQPSQNRSDLTWSKAQRFQKLHATHLRQPLINKLNLYTCGRQSVHFSYDWFSLN